MKTNKVIKFKDFLTTEQTYKPDADGKMIKQEWELYKDWHPAKFKVMSLSKDSDLTPFEDGEFVWIIKRNDVIVTIFSSFIDEKKIEEFFNNIKENPKNINNNIKDNENEDSNL